MISSRAKPTRPKEQLGPLERDRRESALEEPLDDLGVPQAWSLASGLTAAGETVDSIRQLAQEVAAADLLPILIWIDASNATHEAVGILVRSSRRSTEIVQAVKGYTHMDRAAEQLVDLHDGIESTLTILHHALRDVTVVPDFDRSLPQIRVHGNTLNQVWKNILDNAADATDGGGAITIRTRRDGDRAVVEIEDDGPGIPGENLHRIFEPFFTTKPQGVGTGLGLDTAWRIVTQAHGGTIAVESPRRDRPRRSRRRPSLARLTTRAVEGARGRCRLPGVGAGVRVVGMGIEVRPATDFADVRTMLGPKRPDANVCWCLAYRIPSKQNLALRGTERENKVAELMRQGPPGVLAYDGGEVVGWAAVHPRADTTFATNRKIPHVDDLDVWSVWCLRVRPGHRGGGIGHALLAGAVEFARQSGAPAIEGYPVDNRGHKVDLTMAYVGTRALFEKAGFTKAADTDSVINGFPRVLMRLALHAAG